MYFNDSKMFCFIKTLVLLTTTVLSVPYAQYHHNFLPILYTNKDNNVFLLHNFSASQLLTSFSGSPFHLPFPDDDL